MSLYVTYSDIRMRHVIYSDLRMSHVIYSDVRMSHVIYSDVRMSHVTYRFERAVFSHVGYHIIRVPEHGGATTFCHQVSDVTRMNESCHTYESRMNESCHKYEMSQVTHV